MIPDHALGLLVTHGYHILNWAGPYVSTILKIEGRDRYVLLKYENGHFLVVTK